MNKVKNVTKRVASDGYKLVRWFAETVLKGAVGWLLDEWAGGDAPGLDVMPDDDMLI